LQNVTPLIGVAIALFASQLVTTVVYAYVTESQAPSLQSRVPPFVAFVRQLLAVRLLFLSLSPAPRSSLTSGTLQFVAPFYLGIMYEDLGSVSASGILAGLSGPLAFLVRPLSRSLLPLETLTLTLAPLARSSSP